MLVLYDLKIRQNKIIYQISFSRRGFVIRDFFFIQTLNFEHFLGNIKHDENDPCKGLLNFINFNIFTWYQVCLVETTHNCNANEIDHYNEFIISL